MKNKKYSWWALRLMCLMIISSLALTACDDDNDVDTNQVDTSKIALNSFGPSPAVRGGELRFIGTNLDKASSIDMPGAEGITDITKVGKFEIRITIPQTAEPGYIVLKTPEGEITTKTPISYSEPISISSVTPLAVKAGATVKIEGDYLNIVEEIIFSDDVHVLKEDFVSQTRKAIEVKIPIEARSGKIIVSNGADILSDGEDIPVWIYSEEELDVKLPSITSITPNPLKAGGSLTIKGADFDLVKEIVLPGGKVVAVSEATTTITIVETEADIKEGKVTLVAKSGVEVLSAELKLVKPSITTLSATTVKNNETLIISGANLDLVTQITFQNGEVEKADFVSTSEETIELVIPATATDGSFSLNTASETLTESETLTFVKPVFTSFAPIESKPKNSIVLTGQNLDLVENVWFGAMKGEISAQTETEITVEIKVGSESGKIVLETVNGTKVISTDAFTVLSNLPDISGYLESKGAPGKILTILGSNLTLIKELVFPGGIYATAYGIKSDTEIEVYVPENSDTGPGIIVMITYEGEEGNLPEVFIGGTDPVKDPSLMIYSFDAGWSGFTWDGIGGLGTANDGIDGTNHYYEIFNWDASKYWLFANNSLSYESVTKSDHVLKMDVRLRNTVTGNAEIRMMLSGKVVNILPYISVGEGAWSTSGEWITITIPMTEFTDLADPTPTTGGEWGMAMWGGTADFTGLCLDNIRYEKVE